MFQRRLREAPDEAELAVMYATPHDHSIYGYGHWLRVEQTIVAARWAVADFHLRDGADLSCGNAAIAKALDIPMTLGDYAPGYELTGSIETTIGLIKPVGLFICSETIEHLDDPAEVLRQIREKAKCLVLSTPIGEDDLGNPEHLWGWDQEAVEVLLRKTGWDPKARFDVVLPDSYSYQIWVCR